MYRKKEIVLLGIIWVLFLFSLSFTLGFSRNYALVNNLLSLRRVREKKAVLKGNYHYPLPSGSWKWERLEHFRVEREEDKVTFSAFSVAEGTTRYGPGDYEEHIIDEKVELMMDTAVTRLVVTDIWPPAFVGGEEDIHTREISLNGQHFLGFRFYPQNKKLYLIVSNKFYEKIKPLLSGIVIQDYSSGIPGTRHLETIGYIIFISLTKAKTEGIIK